MRTRFKTNRIASSDNYEASKRIHIESLRRFHNTHIDEIKSISAGIKRYYVKCFGRLVEISKKEADKLNKSLIIVKQYVPRNLVFMKKGFLLWSTVMIVLLVISCIDSLGWMTVPSIAVCILLIRQCKKNISLREFYVLSGYKIFNELINPANKQGLFKILIMEYVFVVLLLILAIVLTYLGNCKDETPPLNPYLLSSVMLLIGIVIGIITPKEEPSAIDVYRGKTQLQITETTNSGKVIQKDSTVVYK